MGEPWGTCPGCPHRPPLAVTLARVGALASYLVFVWAMHLGGLTAGEVVAVGVAAVAALTVILAAGWVGRGARRDI
jgi:hypothetical protein